MKKKKKNDVEDDAFNYITEVEEKRNAYNRKKMSKKKSTTYTILKRICERGLFQNDRGWNDNS